MLSSILPSFESAVTLVFVPVKALEMRITPQKVIPTRESFKYRRPFTLHGKTYYSIPSSVMSWGMWGTTFYPVTDNIRYKPKRDMLDEFKTKYSLLLSNTDTLRKNNSSNIDALFTDTWTLRQFIVDGPGILAIQRYPHMGVHMYKIDLNHLFKYKVRPGFLCYGGMLVLDKDLNPIYIEYDNVTSTPGDKNWNKFTFRFTSSLILDLIVRIHACWYHIGYTNMAHTMVGGWRYKFMYPFMHKIFESAEAAKEVLLGPGRYFNRLYAFTAESLDMYISDCLSDSMKPRSFMSMYNEFDELRELRYFSDGKMVYDAYLAYVGRNILSKDNGREYSDHELTSFIFDSTVNHELLGNQILKWQLNPEMSSTKITSDGVCMCDVQSYEQTMLIVMGTTMDSKASLMPVCSDVDQVLADRLRDISRTIAMKNERGKPYYGIYPSCMESSLSQ